MKNEKGITLIALAVSIIVLIIIASISISAGTQVLKEAKIQTVETNLLAIKAKCKAYAEEAEAASWAFEDVTKKNTAKDNKLKDNGLEFIARGKYFPETPEDLSTACASSICTNEKIHVNEGIVYDEISHQLGNSIGPYEVLNQITCEVYYIGNQGLKKIGIEENYEKNANNEEVEKIDYLVIYDSSDFNNMDVIFLPGIFIDGQYYYTLSELQTIHNQ